MQCVITVAKLILIIIFTMPLCWLIKAKFRTKLVIILIIRGYLLSVI